MSGNVNVIKDLEQIGNHFGRGGDVASLTKGVVTGPDNAHEAISILTDTAKVMISYADDLAKRTGGASLATNAVAFVNAVIQIRNDYDAGKPITLSPALKAFSSIIDSGATLLLMQPTPQGKALGLLLKGGAAGLGYLELAVGNSTLLQKTQTLNTLGQQFRTIDQATNGGNDTRLSFSDVAGGGFEFREFRASDLTGGLGVRVTSGTGGSVVASRLNNQFEATDTFGVYTVKSGDSLGKIAQSNGVSQSLLLKANPQITNPNLIYAGEQIKIPTAISDGNASQAPAGTVVTPSSFYIDDLMSYTADDVTYFTGVPLNKLQQLNPGIDFTKSLPAGRTLQLPSPDNTRLTVSTTLTPVTQRTGAPDMARIGDTVNQGYAYSGASYKVSMPIGILNGDGLFNTGMAGIVTDGYRPGNFNLGNSFLGSNSTMAPSTFSRLIHSTSASRRARCYWDP